MASEGVTEASAWSTGKGGFGSPNTPNARIGTEWTSQEIWLRREFEIAAAPKGEVILRIYHDEDATVFLNGEEIANLRDHSPGYILVPLGEKAVKALKTGKNVMAIQVRQTRGGQFQCPGVGSSAKGTPWSKNRPVGFMTHRPTVLPSSPTSVTVATRGRAANFPSALPRDW